jgi:uncharacterized protein
MRIQSADGLSLEAQLDRSDESVATLIICHAHPRMQGTMKSPLLLAIRDEMVVRGWNVLRFNFRGVGASEGEFEDGAGEVSDALGAVEFVRNEFGESPIALLGWSFGGAVALRAATRSEGVAACVAIAPAIEHTRLPSASELGLKIPVLVVCGDNDAIVSPESCRKWAEDAGARYVEVRAANHFFWAKYEVVTKLVADWLQQEKEKKQEIV